jgi:ureidoglycolate lyase
MARSAVSGLLSAIPIEPLTPAAFADFGDVVEPAGAALSINQGFAERIDDLARIDVASHDGRINVALFAATTRPRPIAVTIMERHPLGSQLFYPLQDSPWLVLVCGDPYDARSFRAFLATGRQGVNYARAVWHHPLLVLRDRERFIVLDRAGPGNNLEEARLAPEHTLHLVPSD